MQAGVITFPGSNCDRDIAVALAAAGARVERLWHAETELPRLDLIVLPGGFTYGDYLRCGAIAARAPVMAEVIRRAAAGRGRARDLQRLPDPGRGRAAAGRADQQSPGSSSSAGRSRSRSRPPRSVFTAGYAAGPDGRAPDRPSRRLLRLRAGRASSGSRTRTGSRSATSTTRTARSATSPACSAPGRNVLGLMPHPERAADPATGGTDGGPCCARWSRRLD